MVQRGARNLLILSRSGLQSKAARDIHNELIALGSRVEAPPCNIADADALKTTLASYSQIMPPIRGCIQSTMILRVGLLPAIGHIAI